jgi:beta-lactamase superfamily II metal-dependent hydrolase
VAWHQLAQLEKLAISYGAPVVHELRGNHCDFDGAHGDFLWPQIVPEEIAPSAKNDGSLLFRVKFRERSFLLPGDAEKLSQHHMLSESDPASLQSDVCNSFERLHQGGVPTLRTDSNGTVHIPTDGNNLEVSCFVACPEIAAQINSTKPQTPQDQQGNQQQ